MIDTVDSSVINGKAAKMVPTFHRIAALIQQLARLCIQGHQDGLMRAGAALLGREEILLPFLLALEIRFAEKLILAWVFSGCDDKHDSVCHCRRVGQIYIWRNPGGLKARLI